MPELHLPHRQNRAARISFLSLAFFTVASWACYVAFVKNPQNLMHWNLFPTIFAYSFQVFAQAHVVLCAIAVLSLFRPFFSQVLFKGFLCVYGISLCAELGATSKGLLFGNYAYSDMLGPKAFGLVPVLVPLSWFLVSSCAFGVSSGLFPGASIGSQVKRVMSTAAMIVLWDLTLDPAMSHVFSYWQWNTQEAVYFGAPWTNFLGWSVTGIAIGAALNYLEFFKVTAKLPHLTLLTYYFLLTSLSAGFLFLSNTLLPLFLAGVGYLIWAHATGLMRFPSLLSKLRLMPNSR